MISMIGSFNRSARLFLLAIVINGIIFSTWQLFYNFFILARGFDKSYLGLVNSAPALATLLLGIPLGVLSDRIGERKAMLAGLALAGLAMGVQLIAIDPVLIVIMAFLAGTGTTLFLISQAPFMMKASNPGNRLMLFSLNFGLFTISGSIGNLFAGQMPAFFSRILTIPAQSAQAYQSVLLVAVILGSACLIPIYLIREADIRRNGKELPVRKPLGQILLRPVVIKLVIPNLLTGFGAAILIPYMNVFFSEKFDLPDQHLGVLFSLAALLTGAGSLLGPRLAARLGGKIRAVVTNQTASLFFLLLAGFSPLVILASFGFLMRHVLMNMAVPLFSNFSMEQIPESDQGTANSLFTMSWQVGWAIGPWISGIVQTHYGFNPLFLATGTLYFISICLIWIFFRGTKEEKVLGQVTVRE